MFSVCMRSFLTPLWWKNLLAPRAIGFCVVTRKFGSLFFALICFSFDWRLFIVQTARLFLPCDWRGSFSGCWLEEKKGPLDSTWRLARFVVWLLVGREVKHVG